MTIYKKGTIAHLKGDLTLSGVTQNIVKSLAASLHKMESGGEKNIRIDCGRVRSADLSGLQLLYVWMQCARFRGVSTELINLSESLQQALYKLGLGHCFNGIGVHSEVWM